MSYSKLTFSFCLILILQLHTTSASDPLFHNCSTTKPNATSSSLRADESNLTNLLKVLTSKKTTLSTTGFAIATVGPKSPDPAYGLALCRGDVYSSVDCLSCTLNATLGILKLCPNNKAAIVVYDKCLLKYSNSNFFGKIDETNKFYLWNTKSTGNPKLLNDKVEELLGRLSEEAVEGGDYKLFATGEMDIDPFTRLFGLVQCTRDLTKNDCKICLNSVISELPRCCDGRQGGRVVGGSCNFRYEIFPFVKKYV